jgi:hypothetical protein
MDICKKGKKKKGKNYAGSENRFPYQIRKRNHFGTRYHKTIYSIRIQKIPQLKYKKDKWRSEGEKAWTETGNHTRTFVYYDQA